MMKFKVSFLFFLLYVGLAQAARVDTIAVPSMAMNKGIKTVVIQPDGQIKTPLPTLYLLHGYSGDYADWVNKASTVKELADRYQMLIVCPDGGFGSWYWDVPGDPDFQYETFISKELIAYIQEHYPVADDRSKRGITGLSMGGHGALYLAIKHQDVFGAAGSTSGGVDIRPFPNNWDLEKRLGKRSENPENWDAHTVIEMLHLIQPDSLALFIDCGREDFFHLVNQKLHERLDYLRVPHRYLVMPGAHNWEYWSQSIHYQLAFFSGYFTAQGEDG